MHVVARGPGTVPLINIFFSFFGRIVNVRHTFERLRGRGAHTACILIHELQTANGDTKILFVV